MPGKAKSRFRALVVVSALAACALAPALAPAIAARKGATDASSKSAADASPQGANGVKGVTAASPGLTQAPLPGATRPLAGDERSGLQARVGSLPFTGWDLIILGGVAMVLSGMGFGLHRLSMPRAPYH